jgi:hypothetical protein
LKRVVQKEQGWGRRRGGGHRGREGIRRSSRERGRGGMLRGGGAGRSKGGTEGNEEFLVGWEWKRKRGTRVLRRKAGEPTG